MAIYADRSSPPFPLRCAVNTRTSRAGETDPAFTSINAQQETCYAFIASRHHLTCLPVSVSYEDPGFSGGTLERPALQQMLADIKADRIDMVVVYKLDRLSRGMVHFARLMETFERHHVTLVSLTQHLNSHDAAGRLAINALMTFAQFERENTGERICDKIRATRRQGMWTDSVPPMGYEARGQRLLVNDVEARVVRHIFERFVALGSITDLVRELGKQGVTTKPWTTRTGKARGGRPLDKNYLDKLLNNRTLIGEMQSGDQWHAGAHELIVPADLWDSAHALLDDRRRAKKACVERAA
ncbi:recombinase family protein [Accumulibacter sp.]|uniref:recombinase family protein n=1 Tax=Accumulibacter sp. TaxID=2053492 RepID=UPI001A56C2F3|nr:recombinase family protein [Accumulibacter sp.]MBL8376159.1 recombinase family protein [Accumulibacter sp.]